jgi:transcriptional regulator with XRE-family HTH domain
MDKKKQAFLKKLGERIVAIRETKGITQTELAERCDKDKQSINRLEKGNVNPSVYYLKQVTEALGVSLEYVMSIPTG